MKTVVLIYESATWEPRDSEGADGYGIRVIAVVEDIELAEKYIAELPAKREQEGIGIIDCEYSMSEKVVVGG